MVGQQFGSHASSHSSSMTSLSRTPTTTGSRSENSRDASSSPSLVDSTSTDAPHESCRDGGRAGGVRGDGTEGMDHPRVGVPPSRTPHPRGHPSEEGQESDLPSGAYDSPECGSPQEAGPARPFGPAPEDASNAKCHHHGPEASGHLQDLPDLRVPPNGPSGFREAQLPDIPGGSPTAPRLLRLGHEDSHGGRQLSSPPTPGHMVGAEDCGKSRQGGQSRPQEQEGHNRGHQQCGDTDSADAGIHGSDAEPVEGRSGQPKGGTTSQGTGCLHGCGVPRQLGTTSSTLSSESSEAGSFEPESGPMKQLPESTSRFLTSCVDGMLPSALSSLASSGRLELLEIACSETSILTAEMRRLTGREDAAERLSLWNGCDLSTNEGIRKAVQVIDLKRPRNVWLSPVCGPYSLMQNANQRTPEQVEALQEKRRHALKQYVGCCIIYSYAVRAGCHATWEWSQSCLGWRLPIIKALQERHQPLFAVVRGCQVNLRNDQGDFISKGWKLMTTNRALAETMELPCSCPKNTVHVSCEGSLTNKTAFYTKEFGRRACRMMLQGYTKEHVMMGIQGQHLQHGTFGEGSVCECDLGSNHQAGLSCGSCHHQQVSKVVEGKVLAAGGEPLAPPMDGAMVPHDTPHEVREHQLSKEEIHRKLYLLHASTGHGPVRHLIRILQQQRVSPEILAEARKFQCSVCHERSQPQPRPLASLEPLPPKWETVSVDLGHWEHPQTGVSVQFLMVIDEGSRFRVGRVLLEGSGKLHAPATKILQGFRDCWVQYFGFPGTLRLDADGSFRSHAVEEFCDRNKIYLDMIPGEAHWRIGVCEQAIRGVKQVMQKLVEDDPEISPQEALAEATRVFNCREMVRGYSPIQHALGRAPDHAGRLFPVSDLSSPDLLVEQPTGEMARNLQRMHQAEKAFLEWTNHQRLLRAENSRSRNYPKVEPGDLVYMWRKQVSGSKGSKTGRFVGPARVLALERRQSADGTLLQSKTVWCVRGRRLVKCSLEQLRLASEKETILSELAAGEYSDWDFHRVAKELGGNEFEDISEEVPSQEEWHRAQDPQQEWQPTHRCRGKRSAPLQTREQQPMELDGPSFPEDPPDSDLPPRFSTGGSSSSRPCRSRSRGRTGHKDDSMGLIAEPAWFEQQHVQEQFPESPSSFWADQTAAVTVEIPMPETRSSSERALQDLTSYLAQSIKKRAAVEIREKYLTEEERKMFRSAKAVEVNNFLAAKAFEALPPGLKPDRSKAVHMRWILTWKYKEDGTRKPKARCVLLGYQDPSYEHRATTSPTTTRQTRQLQLLISAGKGFKMRKGDVTGAFLQSRPYPDDLLCVPCPEICEGMGLAEGSLTKVRKACYGLVDAPLEWYRSVCTYLQSLGFYRCWSDPCCWILKEGSEIVGIISAHVDDFLFSGNENSRLWMSALQSIQKEYKWGDWESDRFVQCGVTIEQHADFTFSLSQEKYVEEIKHINLRAFRRKDRKSPTDETEKSQLRALLGALSWHAQQVAPHFSAEIGMLLSEVNRSTIDTIYRANHLLDLAKNQKSHKLLIPKVDVQSLVLVAWVDAGSQNRADGSSTQGILIGASEKNLLSGACAPVVMIAWHSQKIDRICRSPGAAEAAAAVNGEDCLYYSRFQLSEMLNNPIDVRKHDEVVNMIPGALVSDSRNVYDKLQTEVLLIRGAEKRTDISLLSLKEAQERNLVDVRWVHSEAQLANGLTKGGEFKQLSLFYDMQCRWRVVEDPDRNSARKRKALGLHPLENSQSTTSKDPPG